MEHTLACNNLKCRVELTERALVTTCSHVFCLDCAQQLGVSTQNSNQRIACPACKEILSNPDDAVITKLNPSEDYKTSVLSGLGPNVIMECAGRALSFWTYQINQEICYQRHLYKTLADKYSTLNMQFDKTVNNANTEIESLHQKLQTLMSECEAMRRRNEGLAQQYRDKSRQVLQLQEAYDKVKRKVEVGEIEKAAFQAVDSSLLHVTQQATQSFEEQDSSRSRQLPGTLSDHSKITKSRQYRAPNPPQDFANRTWAAQRPSPRIDDNAGTVHRSSVRQSFGPTEVHGPPGYPAHSSTSAHGHEFSRRSINSHASKFGNNVTVLPGVGLTSGLKVGQPANKPGLDAHMRGR